MKKIAVRIVQEYQIPEDHLEGFLDDPGTYVAEYDWFPVVIEGYEVNTDGR